MEDNRSFSTRQVIGFGQRARPPDLQYILNSSTGWRTCRYCQRLGANGSLGVRYQVQRLRLAMIVPVLLSHRARLNHVASNFVTSE